MNTENEELHTSHYSPVEWLHDEFDGNSYKILIGT
jgi:hypothetical protein